MHNKFTKRTIAMAVGVAIVLAGGGVAYAYWSASGTGDGTALTGDTTDFTIEATENAIGLTPGGDAQDVTFVVTNPSDGTQALADVTVTVADATGTAWGESSNPVAPTGCSAADYLVGDVTITSGQIAGGDTLNGSVSITMNNLDANQDACQNAQVPLHFVAS